MNKVLWKFKVDGETHFVELVHDPENNKHGIRLDSVPITNWRQMLSGGIEYEFTLKRLGCLLHIEMGVFGYDYILTVDEVVIEPRIVKLAEKVEKESPITTQEVSAVKIPKRAGRIPLWTWAFVAACAIIPILLLNGALPMAIGVIAAYSVVNIARNERQPVDLRVAFCMGIVGFSWFTFFVIAGGMETLFAAAQ